MSTETFRRYLEEEACLEPEQIRAVMRDGPLVVVSAGAGTGKTLTLAWRFVRLVAVDRVPLERILTITFTEKAALEMRERIRRLMDEVREAVPDFSGLMEDSLSRLDEAYISTIHAFSMRVLRECGLSVDVDPGIRLITPPEENFFWQYLERSIDREETEHLAETLFGKWRDRARDVFSSNLTSDLIDSFRAGAVRDLAASAIPIFESKNLGPDALWEWADDLPRRDAELASRLLSISIPDWRQAWRDWMELILPDAGGPGIFRSDGAKFSARAAAFMESWKTEPAEGDLPRFVMDLLGKEGLLGNLSGATGKSMKAVDGSARNTTGQGLKDYRDDRARWLRAAKWITDGFSSGETEARAQLLRIIALCWELFRSAKSKRGTLSFDDMISRAREAVEAEPSLPGRFLHVIVDEFQDTNSLQDELLSALAPPGTGTLFLVGDLQQSIYRFRHAEPGIFWRRIREAVRDDPESLVELDVTFRSRQAVMDTVNSLFRHIWSDGVARSIEKEFSPLAPPMSREWWPGRQETTIMPFELILPDSDDLTPKAKTGDLRIAAMRTLADRILEAVGSGATVWDSDGKGSFAPRPVTFRDFAVLVPSRAIYDQIEEVFIEERGIPTYFEGNRNYFGRGEVRDAVSLLEAIADPDDALAMASFLASPLSGLSPEEAALLVARSRGEGSSPGSLFEEHSPREASRFEKLRREGLAAGPSRPLTDLLEDSSVLLSYPSWKRPRVAANLRRAIDLAREYEASMGMSLAGCASYLRYMTRKGIESKEADTLGENDDMVRVMTVHSAKGLEFPVVAVTGLEQGLRTRGEGQRLVPSPHLGVVFTTLPESRRQEGDPEILGGAIHDIFETQETWEEKQRLLYVACTRARDSLILCGASQWIDGRPRARRYSWLETVTSWIESNGGKLTPTAAKEGTLPPGRPKEEVRKGERVQLPPEGDRSLEKISATAYALIRYCPFAFRMRHRQGLDISWEMPGGDSVGGADMGSLAHWILRGWDLRAETLSLYDPLREGAGLGSVLPPELRPVWADSSRRSPLFEWLEHFALSPLSERIRDARNAQREVPFRIRLDSGTLMVGVIDVIWTEGGKVFIRDYKIGQIDSAPEALYRSQLLFYALAAGKHFRGSPLDLALVSLKETAEIPIDYSGIPWDGLEKDIAEAARQGATGPFGPSLSACPSCPWRSECLPGLGQIVGDDG